ncbi:hypothetical protein QWZ13_06280 [Reinekea marina]|uniref:Uncharacterized protein n=1 Tax=Reinekea marina TaxID=1310421 RepID=A0ABV7WQJ6_9GAMM|nr:hypothetical protein [Reinekea marina]MDN3648515.1 hypothetical protein [Reinekea marina]
MSNLTAQDWSESAINVLRVKEQNCAETDLFCIGYLIPQVELLEVELIDKQASADWWQQQFIEFVRGNMSADKMQADDERTIEQLMADL